MTQKNEPKAGFDLFVAIWNRLQNQTTPNVHLKITNFLENAWHNKQKHLLLMAFRACGKSTLVGLFCAWLLYKNSNLRILVLAADLPLSKKMVRNVKRIIERHPLCMALKPSAPDQWASERFTVTRDLESRDPSMLARSVMANMTGSRADVIICDDVEVPNTCETEEKRRILREKLAEVEYVLVPDGTQLYIGTPHHYETIYAERPRKELGEKDIFLKGFDRFVLPILDKDGNSVWEERFSNDDISRMKQATGPNKFNSQMLLQPTSIAESYLDPTLLHFYDEPLDYSEINQNPILKIGNDRLIGVGCWWDPAFHGNQEGSNTRRSGDNSVIACVFTGESGKTYLHDIAYLKTDPNRDLDEASQQCEQIETFVENNYISGLTIEINGVGRFLPSLLKQYLINKKKNISVLEKSSRTPKHIRILEAFDARLAARTLYVSTKVTKTNFIREMREWRPTQSKTASDDGLDAVAGALSVSPFRFQNMGSVSSKSADWRNTGQSYSADSSFDI